MTDQEIIEVVKAHMEGKNIRVRLNRRDAGWVISVTAPVWNFKDQEYSVIPEPKYIPWTYETCPMGVMVKKKMEQRMMMIVGKTDKYIFIASNGYSTYEGALGDWEMADGSPCGTLVEEGK